MSARFRLLTALTVLGLPASALAQKQPQVPDNVELIRDVEYGKGGNRMLHLHILRPKTPPKEPMPVVVWFHGGGWETGHRDGGIFRLVRFAQRGYLCATVEYRLSGEAVFPAQIEDAKCAIRFLRAKANDFNLDPKRIGAWGYSAGGHLVELLGTSAHVKELEGKGGWPEASSAVQAVCSAAGVSDFAYWGDKAHPAVVKLLGGAVGANKEKAILASPIAHVGKNLPPFLLIHGDKDGTVPVSQSELLYAALKKAGADATLRVIKDGSHNLLNAETDKLTDAFFDKHLSAGKAKKSPPSK